MTGFKKLKGRRVSSRITTPRVNAPHFSACHDTYALSGGRVVLTDRLVATDVPSMPGVEDAGPCAADCEWNSLTSCGMIVLSMSFP